MDCKWIRKGNRRTTSSTQEESKLWQKWRRKSSGRLSTSIESFDKLVQGQGTRRSGSFQASPPPTIGPGQVIYSKDDSAAQQEGDTWDAGDTARQTRDAAKLGSLSFIRRNASNEFRQN